MMVKRQVLVSPPYRYTAVFSLEIQASDGFLRAGPCVPSILLADFSIEIQASGGFRRKHASKGSGRLYVAITKKTTHLAKNNNYIPSLLTTFTIHTNLHPLAQPQSPQQILREISMETDRRYRYRCLEQLFWCTYSAKD